mmetsp:Transcript_15469/g.41758  ORF Transcript_15469/g.41758 Transcript_15469/m.41758 type:complete len:207 (-) Transcript_15469:65-685(-)
MRGQCGGPCALLCRCRRRLLAVAEVEAQAVADELAGDLAGAEGHGDLVAGAAGLHGGAIVIDVDSMLGFVAVVAVVDAACLALTLPGRDNDVARARVEDDGELLRDRRANGNGPEINALEGHCVIIAPDRHTLPVQRDCEATGWVFHRRNAQAGEAQRHLHQHRQDQELGQIWQSQISGCHVCTESKLSRGCSISQSLPLKQRLQG